MASILLLALAQAAATPSAALPANDRAAGLACASAVALGGDRGRGAMQLTSEVTYFVMQAAKADPGSVPFPNRTSELIGELKTRARPTATTATAQLAQCYRRWPMAEGKAVVRLPTVAFHRRLTCVGALGILMGAAEEVERTGGGAAERIRYQTATQRYTTTLSDAMLRAEGVSTEAQMGAVLGDQLKASLQIGNARSIADACIAAAP